MIRVENIETFGWEAAARGMRNPMNSWQKNATGQIRDVVSIGDADLDLMKRLVKAGREHRKFMRMIHVQMDITAPLYWWKEYDTYKIGTATNSCSTMHKIHAKPIELTDFSYEDFYIDDEGITVEDCFKNVVADCEMLRKKFLETKDKSYWRALIQLLPSSYNQRRTVDINYEVVMTMIRQRTGHRLDEWRKFLEVLEDLPYVKEMLE